MRKQKELGSGKYELFKVNFIELGKAEICDKRSLLSRRGNS